MNNEPSPYHQHVMLVIENDSLKRELEITKHLITKGVLDSHSYILGFVDGKALNLVVLKENIKRAIQMLEVSSEYIEQTDPYGLINYDDADCDGGCVAEDCRSIAESLRKLLR